MPEFVRPGGEQFIILPPTKPLLPQLWVPSAPDLVLPTDEERARYSTASMDRRPGRTSTDFALAYEQPHRFIAKEAEKILPARRSQEVNEVLAILRTQNEEISLEESYDTAHLLGERTEKKFNNMLLGIEETFTTYRPGPLETVALAVCHYLDDPELTATADVTVLGPLNRLFQEYRIHTHVGEELPGMPELTQLLLEKLDDFSKNRAVRHSMYDLLGQVALSPDQYQQVVMKMDRSKDLAHPLAFKSTLELAQFKPDAAWLDIQAERRAFLLDLLNKPNQEIFDHFETLFALSSSLVSSGDLRDPTFGRIGIEIELELNERANKYKERMAFDTYALGEDLGLEEETWRLGSDSSNYELRKSDAALAYGRDYHAEIITVARWLKDYGKYLKSLHIHLDNTAHPNEPSIGELFHDKSQERYTVGPSEKHTTWEVRALNLPRANGTIHPARLADVIDLYIGAASPQRTEEAEQLVVKQDDPLSIKKMTWGHITTFIKNPDIRLAALMALHDEKMLAAVNPFSFALSVKKESLQTVVEKLKPQLRADQDRFYIDMLGGYASDTVPEGPLTSPHRQGCMPIVVDILWKSGLDKTMRNRYADVLDKLEVSRHTETAGQEEM